MKHLDLFSGIGGFALACQWAGIETIGFVEIDKYCQKVLRKHWPDVPIVEDIRDVERIKEIVANAECTSSPSWREWENGKCQEDGQKASNTRGQNQHRPDTRGQSQSSLSNPTAILITAGFPCQPFSVAGKQRSTEDDRYLWPETLAVIKAVKPSWVLLENVTGIINLALDTVLSDLEGAGYSTETLIIPACAVNAWHRRDRVWIVAHTKCNEFWRSQRGGDMETETVQTEYRSADGTTRRTSRTSTIRTPDERLVPWIDVADTQREGLEGTDTTRDSRTTGQPSEYGQGERQADWWAVEPGFCGMVDELSQRLDESGLSETRCGIMVSLLRKEIQNATSKKDRRGEILPAMSQEVSTPEVQRGTGEQPRFPQKEVLQPPMYGKTSGESEGQEGRSTTTGKEVSREPVPGMWDNEKTGDTPHRRQYGEQCPGEPDDALPELPHEMALESWEGNVSADSLLQSLREACTEIGYVFASLSEIPQVWQSLTDEEKNWVTIRVGTGEPFHAEWPDIPRVATGIKNRVDRLKCLGNAIVPQVAYEIIRVIKETGERNG